MMQSNRAAPRTANALRFGPGASGGHVESYFWRANHPSARQAFWLKATILKTHDGHAVTEAWCALFDGDTKNMFGAKHTVPWAEAQFDQFPGQVSINSCRFELAGDRGTSVGSLEGKRGTVAWDLSWKAVDGSLGAPLCLYPSAKFIEGPFPRSKLLTPSPALRFSGTIRWNDSTIQVNEWLGMQGHNWGREHAYRYAWGQCIFADHQHEPVCMVEAASGQLKLGPVVTPPLSTMVIRRGEREYRFDRFYALWAAKSTVRDTTWTLHMRGADGEALLALAAQPEEMVCLGYINPDGALSYCLNSKLSRATLRVSPVNEPAFECVSEHGAALELLQREPDPRFPEVV